MPGAGADNLLIIFFVDEVVMVIAAVNAEVCAINSFLVIISQSLTRVSFSFLLAMKINMIKRRERKNTAKNMQLMKRTTGNKEAYQ